MTRQAIDRRALLRGLGAAAAVSALPACLAARGGPWAASHALLDDYVSQRLPGAVLALGRAGAPTAFLARGRIALGPAPAAGTDTLWRIYSMTKPVTGIAAMLLVEEGRIALDQNIADFIPGFAHPTVLLDPAKDMSARAATRPITVRNLLTHTAGLGYGIITTGPLLDAYKAQGLLPYSLDPATDGSLPRAPSLAVFADRLATLPLIADPGTEWSYSMGLDVLGRVIEVASGQPFDAFLKTRLFEPLGMASSFFQVPATDLGRLAANYRVTAGKLEVIDGAGAASAFARPPAFPYGGAGLVSSAHDYDRFLAMLQGEGTLGRVRVMKPETARLAMSNLMPAGAALPPAIEGFGAGGEVTLTDRPGGKGAGTFGWGGAAQTVGFVDRKRGLRAGGFVNYMSRLEPAPFSFPEDFPQAAYRDLAA